MMRRLGAKAMTSTERSRKRRWRLRKARQRAELEMVMAGCQQITEQQFSEFIAGPGPEVDLALDWADEATHES